MSHLKFHGYLVILSTSEDPNPLNPAYRGVDCIPSYPTTYPEEEQAMEAYVFEDFKDERTGLIPNKAKALRLLRLFESSPRKFDLIYCTDATAEPPAEDYSFLGFDIAGLGGDYWSIVGDFPVDRRVRSFLAHLNRWGLFDREAEAAEFLRRYRALKLPHHDIDFQVIKVHARIGRS